MAMKFSAQVQSARRLEVSLRDARRAQGMTQAELAEATGLTRPWISQFERGKIPNAGLSRIFAICHALGVKLTVGYDVDEPGDSNGSGESASTLTTHDDAAKNLADATIRLIQPALTEIYPNVAAMDKTINRSLAHVTTESQQRYQSALKILNRRAKEVRHGEGED